MSQAMPSIPSRSIVAENVRQQRLARGLTQVELAEKAGVTQPRIVEIEAGKHNQRTDTLDKISAALGVSPASLLISVESEVLSE